MFVIYNDKNEEIASTSPRMTFKRAVAYAKQMDAAYMTEARIDADEETEGEVVWQRR